MSSVIHPLSVIYIVDVEWSHCRTRIVNSHYVTVWHEAWILTCTISIEWIGIVLASIVILDKVSINRFRIYYTNSILAVIAANWTNRNRFCWIIIKWVKLIMVVMEKYVNLNVALDFSEFQMKEMKAFNYVLCTGDAMALTRLHISIIHSQSACVWYSTLLYSHWNVLRAIFSCRFFFLLL